MKATEAWREMTRDSGNLHRCKFLPKSRKGGDTILYLSKQQITVSKHIAFAADPSHTLSGALSMITRRILAVAALAAAFAIAAPVSAITTGNVYQDITSATAGSGSIHVDVDGSTVTLFGYSEKTDALAAERAARAAPGIDTVINHIESNS